MGTLVFVTEAVGNTAEEAFQTIRKTESQRYKWMYEPNAPTGCVADKETFVMVEVPEGHTPRPYACDLIHADDPRIVDPLGPAGCVVAGEGRYIFFGFAPAGRWRWLA